MANHKSSEKRIRRNARRTDINVSRRSRIRTFIKKVESEIESGNVDAAKQAFAQVQPEMDKGVSKGIFHKNTAARKLSRLSARIKALAA